MANPCSSVFVCDSYSVANPCSSVFVCDSSGYSRAHPGVVRELSGARLWLVRDQHFLDEPRTTPDESQMGHPGVNPGQEVVVLNILIHRGPEPGPAKDQPGSHPGPQTGEM